jgi:hypothetical protein
MEKKKVFTVLQVPGSKRQSHRNYTHAVIGIFNWDRLIKETSIANSSDISNHEFQIYMSGLKEGDLWGSDGPRWPARQENIDKAKEYLKKYPTIQDWISAKVSQVKEQRKKDGGKFRVLSWSQSYENALKASRGYEWYLNVQVVSTSILK